MTTCLPGSPSGRRVFLRLLVACTGALVGCGGAPAPTPLPRPEEPPLPPIDALTDLCALARLRWLVRARPREITGTPFLIPSIGAVVSEPSFSAFAASTGIDLRQATEVVVAAYAPEARGAPPELAAPSPPEAGPLAAPPLDRPAAPRSPGPEGSPEGLDGATRERLATLLSPPDEVLLYLVRHASDATAIERLFRARLVAKEHRAVDRRDVVRVSGTVGTTKQTLVVLGRDVVGFQHGGSASRGPARVASLYAAQALKRSPTALGVEPLAGLAKRLGSAPAVGLAPGPFEGELARGGRGLLAGATGIGVAARPSAREGIGLTVAVAGDFATRGDAAAERLVAAWDELATSSFGHLLGLDRPVQAPLPTHGKDAVAIAVELDPKTLARGLRAATSARIDEIMR